MGVGESNSIDDFQKSGWMNRSATLSSSVANEAIFQQLHALELVLWSVRVKRRRRAVITTACRPSEKLIYLRYSSILLGVYACWAL